MKNDITDTNIILMILMTRLCNTGNNKNNAENNNNSSTNNSKDNTRSQNQTS